MTWLAPASRKAGALSAVMPPPTWRPPGKARSASIAARSFAGLGPSMITWPPCNWSFANSSANQLDGWVATKFVLSDAPALLEMEGRVVL